MDNINEEMRTEYMCIFCDIIEGKIPSKKIYEDEKCIAILDISQLTKGHTLVIPKQHFSGIDDCDEETLRHLISVTRKLAVRITERLNAPGFHILNNCNPVANQSVMHMHFHIIPRYSEKDCVSMDFTPHHEEYDLEEIRQQLI